MDINALEIAARQALANGTFEDSEEEVPALVEEFYPEAVSAGEAEGQGEVVAEKPRLVPRVSKLTERLGSKANPATGQEVGTC